MNMIRLSYFLSALMATTLFGCKPEKAPDQDLTVVLRDTFQSQDMNLKTMYSTQFRNLHIHRPRLKEYIRATFLGNKNAKKISLGKSFEQNEGWLYFEIVNPSSSEKRMVFSTTHLRCDALTLYSIRGDSLRPEGSISLQKPLQSRAYPLFDFAIPFSADARDTTFLLLKSERFSGFHEVIPRIAVEKVFLKEALTGNLKILIRSSLCLLLMLLMLTLGLIFKQRLMIFYSLFLFSMALVFTVGNGYADLLHYPRDIALKPSNVIMLTIFICNALIHPYCLAMLGNLQHYRVKFGKVARLLAGLNLSISLLFLFPAVPFFNQLTTYGLIVLTISNMVWILYLSTIILFNTGIYSFFAVAVLSFTPTIIEGFMSAFNFTPDHFKLDDNYLNSLFIILLISYLTIDQFRNELMSKRNHEKNIRHIKETMDGIRRAEIEHIGRNLHDQVGNTLASALGYLNMKVPMVDMSKKLIFDGINEIRFLSHNLVRNEDISLTDKLESLISRFNDFSSINFQYKDYSSGNINGLSRLKQENIFMIVQEILTNIIRHSRATEAYIQIFNSDNNFELSIEDDGTGIDPQQKEKGMGLIIMKKRAELAHLKLTIDSGSKGTNIIIDTKNND